MKRVLYENPAVTTITTTLNSPITYNNTVLTVADTSAFVNDNFILIEKVGFELCEIRKISSIDSATQMTLSTGVTYPHDQNTVITKINYDKYQIKYGTTPSPATVLVTNTLNYADKHNQINYLDERATASDADYYDIYYYNSHTTSGALQASLHNQNNYSYITLDDFKAETGITGTLFDNYISDALLAGVEYIRSKAFLIQRFEGHTNDTVFEVQIGDNHFADWNADRVIDKNDITVFEYDNASETIYKTYLANKIVGVIDNGNKIIFSENVPSAGHTLAFEIPTAKLRFEDARFTYREVNKLSAANYLLANSTIDTVKKACLSWTAGGTTVNKDPMSIQGAIKYNQERIDKLMNDILVRTYVASSKLRTRASILNKQNYGSGTIATEGGNVYRW